MLLRDQLLNCPDETLGGALYEALDDRADTISVTELLKEIRVLAVVTKNNIVELSKTPRDTDQGVTVTVDEEGRMIILSPEGHSQHSSVETTKPDVAEFNTDMMLRAEFNTDMMLGAEFSTDMMLGAEFEKLSVVKTTCGDKRVHMVHGLPLHEAPDDAKEGGEEVQRGEVPHSVLPPDCSLTQFASFQNAWNHFSEQYKSWHRDESQYVVHYELNYKLLASIPEPLEDEIYRDLGYKVETISTKNLLTQIKRIDVTWALEHAQWSELEKMLVKEVAEHAKGEDEDNKVAQFAVENAEEEPGKRGTQEGGPMKFPSLLW